MAVYYITNPDCLAACGCSGECCVTAKIKLWWVNRTGYAPGAYLMEYISYEIYDGATLIYTGIRYASAGTSDEGSTAEGLHAKVTGDYDWLPAPLGQGKPDPVVLQLNPLRFVHKNSYLCGGDGTVERVFHGAFNLSESLTYSSDPSGNDKPWASVSPSPAVLSYWVSQLYEVILCRR